MAEEHTIYYRKHGLGYDRSLDGKTWIHTGSYRVDTSLMTLFNDPKAKINFENFKLTIIEVK